MPDKGQKFLEALDKNLWNTADKLSLNNEILRGEFNVTMKLS